MLRVVGSSSTETSSQVTSLFHRNSVLASPSLALPSSWPRLIFTHGSSVTVHLRSLRPRNQLRNPMSTALVYCSLRC
uniref:Uncharacterized protein n=1 Tax=Arundo donax TaxID=35708 RepID=A0A0A9E2C1_ARUDO